MFRLKGHAEDRRKARLFGPIVFMTVGGLVLLILLAIFLVLRFDKVAADREQKMVENGFNRQLGELDAIIVPQVNWDAAVTQLDHTVNLKWADFNIGSQLYTFNGFTRSFVINGNGKPIYASVKGERANLDAIQPFAPTIVQLSRRIHAAEAMRPPIVPSPKGEIVTEPIQANAIADIDGVPFIVIATLVQPDLGKVLPRGPRAPVAIIAMPIDQAFLGTFADRYLVHGLKLQEPEKNDAGFGVDLHSLNGQLVRRLVWNPRGPGTELLSQLWIPALFSICLLGLIALIVVQRGAAIFSELQASETRARHLAFHDPLTKLPNRSMLFSHLSPMLVALRSGSPPVAIVAVDLDRFKEVNDSLGHHAGDALIQGVAGRLRDTCGTEAMIARLGGDEFIVVIENADQAKVASLAERIVAAVRHPFQSEYGQLEVGCSLGVVIVDRAGVDPSEALRWADLALYRSKDNGRARVTFFEPEMDAALRHRRSLETDLREALSDGALHMAYQPQVDKAGRVVAVEALLRWSHPVRGLVPPGIFVPLAEESGLILPLGEYVLRRVFEETGDWSGLRIAINVSPVQLRSPGFAALVLRLIAQTGVDPNRYEIELTETALLGDDPVTASNVEALKRMGFSIALDDFGTGYSSLSVLQRFSVDRIKIDRSFVSALGGADESEALVDAMVKLARALNLDVIAEGVETESQKERLVLCGCREFQGHLIGKPMPLVDLADMIGIALPERKEGTGDSASEVRLRA